MQSLMKSTGRVTSFSMDVKVRQTSPVSEERGSMMEPPNGLHPRSNTDSSLSAQLSFIPLIMQSCLLQCSCWRDPISSDKIKAIQIQFQDSTLTFGRRSAVPFTMPGARQEVSFRGKVTGYLVSLTYGKYLPKSS